MFRVGQRCVLLGLLLLGCSSAGSEPPSSASNGGSGGFGATGGGALGSGGSMQASAGQSGTNTAGANAGGALNTAGAAGFGASPSATGGATGVAGASGTSSGGTSSGGTSSGGTSSGGGSNVAGAAGAATCDWSAPPANVSAWVDESWNSELGTNIKTRKAWNLDNVMLNKGQMNLCVRWGATSAVPASVRMNLESTISRWFNDWFKALGSYGCFPYGSGIKVKVTGWAVKPGQQGLLAGVDSSIPVYTETDGDGEPKCPDACSSFVHWDHQFASCPGGDANHSDYWLWFDDTLPGGGGAAAVGGDWGLRMPVSTFVNHFNDTSFLICEHEMGHGFGFQDYYTWTGSTPAGGSLMIVGSTGGKQSPTVGDTWLLRRTWKEMKALRGW
jgi:hypothetical protein